MKPRLNERLRALQLLLKQVRAAGGAWSDGQRILRGQDLADYRAGIVDQTLLARQKGVSRGPEPKDALPWRNAAQLLVMMRRANPTGGGALIDLLRQWTIQRPGDPSSVHRRRIASRALRHHFRHLLPEDGRHLLAADDREKRELEASLSRRAWILRQDVHIGSNEGRMILPKDSPIRYIPGHGFHASVSGQRVSVPFAMVRRLRPRDRRRLEHLAEDAAIGEPEF